MESLLSMSLFLVVILCSLECFAIIRTHFFDLKQEEENNCAAYAALDRMKTDIREAGYGLLLPIRMGIIQGISEEGGALVFISREKDIVFLGDLVKGQTWIPVENTDGIKKGHEVCFHSENLGEVLRVESVENNSLVMASPLSADYPHDGSCMSRLRRVSCYLDHKKNILRRKVNTSPAQPLVENIQDFVFSYEAGGNLLYIGIHLSSDMEKLYECTIYPKNTALARL